MTRQEVFDWCRQQYGTKTDYPWNDWNAVLRHAENNNQMFAVVTADSGCGKSTLIRRFYSELPKKDYIVLYLSDLKLTPRWFYKGLLDQLGLESRFYRGDSKRQLQQEIEIIRGVQHKKVVCILDEAHLLEKNARRIPISFELQV